MTFTYSRITPSADPDKHCPDHCGTFLKFHSPDRARACLEVLGASWPRPAIAVPVSAPDLSHPGQPRASFILHKDPEGSWMMDQWRRDRASNVRSISDRKQDCDESRSPASDNADTYFIIEIG
jgi:hypothetical protein